MGGRLANGAIGGIDVATEDGLGSGSAVVGALHHERTVMHLVLEKGKVVFAIDLDELRRLEVAADHSRYVGLLPKDRGHLAQFE